VSLVTKSGTNAFHGVAFEFVRNGMFNARNAFAIRRDTIKRNQFGGTIGGPIKKNKLFFFGGYQGTLTRQDPADETSFVPTNSVPLAAASQYGEVHGLGNGLYAWFGIELGNALSVLKGPAAESERQRIIKQMLGLICAARAPSYYLREDRSALEARVDYYV
jgi:hypothetical protein